MRWVMSYAAAAAALQGGIVKRQAGAVRKSVRIKPRGIDDVHVCDIAVNRGLDRICGRLEVFQVPAQEKRLVILGKQII
mgnify:CR=1 FL=1